MWFIDWYKKNSTYINAFLITAGVLGVLGGASCLFPPVLAFLTAIPLFAFLTVLPAPVSSLIMGVISASFSFGVMAFGAALTRQMRLVGSHVFALFASEPQPTESVPTSNSHALMQPYLQRGGSRYRKDAELEDDQAELEEESAPKAPLVVQVADSSLKPISAVQPEITTSMASFNPS